MKKIKYLTTIMTVIFILVPLSACGGDNPAKDEFKEYINNHAIAKFTPKNEEIVTKYTEAVQAGDGDVLATVLREVVLLNAHLIEDLEVYTPQTTEVQDLHNIFIQAVKLRELAYVEILLVLTDLEAELEDIDAAFDKLDETDKLFIEFSTKVDNMKEEFGFK